MSVDIMIEAKMKEQAILQLRSQLHQSTFKTNVSELLHEVHNIPSVLEEKNTDASFEDMLNHQNVQSGGQSSGNKATLQEVNFAKVAEKHGFRFAPYNTLPTENGLYYKYQPNGSQKHPDFLLGEVRDGTWTQGVMFDLKHSNSENIFLNDGWFIENTIYIISYNCNRKNKTATVCISLGKHIPTEEETTAYNEIKKKIREINDTYKKIGSLRCYVRKANQYSMTRFTTEYMTEALYKTVQSLESISSSVSSPEEVTDDM
jgi:hypothetical protein